jgi:hypothetical protein
MRRLLLVTAALCVASVAAHAAETLKWREITHYMAVQSQDVGDADGHAVSLGICRELPPSQMALLGQLPSSPHSIT